MADTDLHGSLKEALFETINGCLSSDQANRQAAEQRLAALEVTEEYGYFLTEFVVNPDSTMSIRLMASVLLKQYTETHWSSVAEKFHPPEVKAHIKEKIKLLLPLGLSESHSKIRLAVAAAISKIAQWEWPENWTGLFDILVNSLNGDNTHAVHGAMRVLTEFSRDLTDTQLPTVGSVILQEMLRILSNDTQYSIRTRGRAVEIFTTIASLTADTGLYKKGYIEKQSTLPTVLPLFCEKFVHCLGVPDGPTSDYGLKTEIIRSINTLICKLSKYMVPYVQQILPPMWTILTESAKMYQEKQVDQDGAEDDANVDSDGEVINFNSLITATFDFISAFNDEKKYANLLNDFLPDIMYHVILFMQITEDQINLWTSNPKQFIEEEDQFARTYGVRVSAQEFLGNFLTYSNEISVNALCSAITRHIESANNPQIQSPITRNSENLWKIYEACIAALITAKDAIVELHRTRKLQFDLIRFLNNVVLSTLNNPGAPPLLLGRCLCIGGCYAKEIPPEMSSKFLEATVVGLQSTQPICIRISSIKATGWFCHAASAENSPLLEIIRPFLPTLFQGLFALSDQPSSEILLLIMDAYSVLISLDQDFTASIENKICPYTIAVFLKFHSDPDIFNFCQDIFEILCKNPNCVNLLQTRLVPTLTSMIDGPGRDKAVDESIQITALDLLGTVVQFSPVPLSPTLITIVFPTVCHCILNATDNGTLQTGGELIRTFLSVAAQQIIEYRDSEGRTGLQYILQIISKLLNPQSSEFTAAFVGRLVTTLIRKAANSLGDNLDQLLRAVLSKMQQTETPVVMQSLLMIWSYLINSQFEAVLNFLSSVPGPHGNSALDFVFKEWMSKQQMFYHVYERKISVVALCKILEHGVTTQDSRLNEIIVDGEVIFSENESRMRTRNKSHPMRWTQIPVLIKIFKLIIYEYGDYIEANSAEEDVEESDDDDETEENQIVDPGTESNSLLMQQHYEQQQQQQEEDEDDDETDESLDDEFEQDPEVRQDPIYQMNLGAYLKGFLQNFATHPNFHEFVPHLNSSEKKVLNSLNINL